MIYPGEIYNVPRQIIKWTFEFTNNGINNVQGAKVVVSVPSNVKWISDYSTKGVFIPSPAGGELIVGTLYKNETVKLSIDFEVINAGSNITITGTVIGDAVLTDNSKSSIVKYRPLEIIGQTEKVLIINMTCESGNLLENYVYENTIGDYTFEKAGNSILFTFPDMPEQDGSENMIADVSMLGNLGTYNPLCLAELHGNIFYFQQNNRITGDIMPPDFYEAIFTMKFKN